MSFKSGDRLNKGQYTIDNQIGYGRFTVTYKAKDRQGNDVVIKTVSDRILNNNQKIDKIQRKLMREANILRGCQHPNIVKAYISFSEKISRLGIQRLSILGKKEIVCVPIEFIDGQTLEKLPKPLLEADALNYIRQIGEALMLVHQQKLLHQNVKPSNIMLRRSNGEVVLINFGLAKQFTDQTQQLSQVSFTNGFAPFEQYQGEGRIGEHTDVYALSATLYYLLTKKIPSPAVNRVSKDDLIPPKQHNSRISDTVNQTILMGMAIKSEDRPSTIKKWLELFNNPLLDELPTIVGMDYRKLRDLLAHKKWKEADQETNNLILKLCNREDQGWLRLEDIDKIPCPDLKTIDTLWLRHSKNRFGFSIQKRIWERVGGNRFGERVGWYFELLNLGWTMNPVMKLAEQWTWDIFLDTSADSNLLYVIYRLALNTIIGILYIFYIFIFLLLIILVFIITFKPRNGYLPSTIHPVTELIIGQSVQGRKKIEQLYIDKQEDLIPFRQKVAKAMTERNCIEQQYRQNLSEANKWEQRAKIALAKGEEELSKEASRRQESHLTSADRDKSILDKQTEQVNKLRNKMVAMEYDVSELKAYRNYLDADYDSPSEIATFMSKLESCNINTDTK